MKAKYILRGLGVGIIITAVVMTAYTRKAVADARVKVLKEYGIGEEAKLVEAFDDTEVIPFGDERASQASTQEEMPAAADENLAPETGAQAQKNTETENAENQVPGFLQNTAADNKPADNNAAGDKPADNNAAGDKPAENENAGEQKSAIVVEPEKDKNTITIVITKGDDSGTVARKLRNAGLVDSAAEFDAFLIQHGYDKRINTGTKTLKSTDSWQELAEKISK